MKKILLLFIVLIFSCSEKKNSRTDLPTGVKIKIDEAIKDKLVLNSFIKDVSFVQLQNIDLQDYIAEIHSVFNVDNKYFVFDKKKSNIFVFSASGMLLNKIGIRGNGPGEYNKISDFCIDKSNRKVFVIDENSMAVLTYDFEGLFIKKEKFDTFFPRNMAYTNNTFVFSTYNSNMSFYDLIFTDLNGTILKEEIPYPSENEYFGFDYTGGINNKSASPLYQESLSSVIYEISNKNSIKEKYNIDFGKTKWPEEKKYSHAEYSEFKRKVLGTELLTILNNKYIENNKYFVFGYTNHYEEIGFYNKNTKVLFTTKYIRNQSSNNYQILRFFSIPVGLTTENKFISGLYPDFYNLLREENEGFEAELKKINPELASMLLKTSPEDNPILMIYDYK